MTDHVVSALLGLLGGSVPGGLHLAWKIRRNTRVTSGNIDLTYGGTTAKKVK